MIANRAVLKSTRPQTRLPVGRSGVEPEALDRNRARWPDVAPSRGSRLSLRTVLILARKETRDALRNRWFILYAVCFAVLTLALSSVALVGTGRFGLAGFGRTAASLVNLVLLIVPLMALTLGAGALAGEKERGTLDTLLAQPVTRLEILLGKYAGMAIAILGALALGFGSAGAYLAFRGAAANASQFAVLFGLSVVLAWEMLSIGFLLSSIAQRTSVATGAAIFTWLALLFLSDLGLLGATMTLRLTADELLYAALANPIQVFKIWAVGSMYRSLDLFGPAGLYASQQFGAGLKPLLAVILIAWTVVPLAGAGVLFSRRVA